MRSVLSCSGRGQAQEMPPSQLTRDRNQFEMPANSKLDDGCRPHVRRNDGTVVQWHQPTDSSLCGNGRGLRGINRPDPSDPSPTGDHQYWTGGELENLLGLTAHVGGSNPSFVGHCHHHDVRGPRLRLLQDPAERLPGAHRGLDGALGHPGRANLPADVLQEVLCSTLTPFVSPGASDLLDLVGNQAVLDDSDDPDRSPEIPGKARCCTCGSKTLPGIINGYEDPVDHQPTFPSRTEAHSVMMRSSRSNSSSRRSNVRSSASRTGIR